MDSSLTHKLIKARRYAEEPGRIHIEEMEVRLEGDQREHTLGFSDGVWVCDCEYFTRHRLCAHTMAMERVLKDLLAPHAN